MTAFKNSFVTTDNVENIFYYMLLSCHEFQSEFTLYSLPGCQGTPCSKQAPYLKFKLQQRNSNPQPLSS